MLADSAPFGYILMLVASRMASSISILSYNFESDILVSVTLLVHQLVSLYVS